jgi:hypothetical protein
MYIFKAGIEFVFGVSLPMHLHDEIDSNKESILWNWCLGSLKEKKFGLCGIWGVADEASLQNYSKNRLVLQKILKIIFMYPHLTLL